MSMDRIPILPCKVKAVFSWSPESPHDLGFVEGDFIEVLNTGDGDWWTGRHRRTKLVGTFPRNYVEYTDRRQPTVPHPDVAAELAIKQSLPREYVDKSTKDILNDISMEMNEMSFYEPRHKSDFQGLPEEDCLEDDNNDDHDNYEDDAPPPPPPHLIIGPSSSIGSGMVSSVHESDVFDDYYDEESYSCPYTNGHRTNIETAIHRLGDEETTFITERGEQTLLQPLSNSPVLEEVPFNPNLLVNKNRTPASHANRTLSGRSQSFDLGPVTKTKGLVRKLLRGIIDSSSELKRSSSMTELRKDESRRDIGSIPKLTNLKFWKQEQDDLEPDLRPTEAAATMVATKALLDPHWMDSAQDLYRAKTLSSHECAKRRRRQELEGAYSSDPFKLLERDDTEYYDYYLENFDHVDDSIMTMSTWPQLLTPGVLASSKIGRNFQDPVDRLRGIFMLCAVYITYVPSTQGPDGSDSPAALSRIMQSKRATPFELAHVVKSMCDAVGLECEVVRGHFRPTDGSSGFPHAWNTVNIEGDWRFLDASVASPTFPGSSEDEINTFYFLTPPNEMIFTHIPNEPNFQHLTPPVPTSVAVCLPVAAPGAFRDSVSFIDFWSGMASMNDLEPCEYTLTLPNNQLDIVAEVEVDTGLSSSVNGSSSLRSSTNNSSSKSMALSQPFWKDGRRFFRVKAVLPEGISKGSLKIYTVERSLEQQRTPNQLVLAYSIAITHRGNNAPFQFVSRFGHPRALRQDIYISEPQCKVLKGGQNYKFIFQTSPSRGETAGSGLSPVRLAMQSPSGRISKLTRTDRSGSSSNWASQIRTLEVGCWRAVVRDDDGEGWAPFAEWYCT